MRIPEMSDDGELGLIADFQDFAVHDGPGLRVLVFLKGCPLRCEWCQNPETLTSFPEISYHALRCVGCLQCLDACPIPGAITEDKEHLIAAIGLENMVVVHSSDATFVCHADQTHRIKELLELIKKNTGDKFL